MTRPFIERPRKPGNQFVYSRGGGLTNWLLAFVHKNYGFIYSCSTQGNIKKQWIENRATSLLAGYPPPAFVVFLLGRVALLNFFFFVFFLGKGLIYLCIVIARTVRNAGSLNACRPRCLYAPCGGCYGPTLNHGTGKKTNSYRLHRFQPRTNGVLFSNIG